MQSKTRSKPKSAHIPKPAIEPAIDTVSRVMFTLFMDLKRPEGRDAVLIELLCRRDQFFSRFKYAEIDVARGRWPQLHFTHPVFDWDVVTLSASFMGADPADEMEHKIAMVSAPAAYFARCKLVNLVFSSEGKFVANFDATHRIVPRAA